jgi:Putative adhesin
MPRWTVADPIMLDFDRVAALRVRAISGSVAVLSTDDRCCLDIDDISGQPLLVSHEDDILTISYEDLTWDGLLGWLRPQRHSAAITVTVPTACPVQLGVVSAGAIVSGISAQTSVKSVSGNITLDGVTGSVDATTVSGDIEAQGVGGRIGFNSVSGDLTLADGSVDRLDAKTVSGRITADIELDGAARLQVGTVSGPVAIRLPQATSTQVELRSTAGRVQSEFGGLHARLQPGSNVLNGQLGRGGPGRVAVTTMSGQVTLLQRGDPGAAQFEDGGATAGGSR